MHNTIGLKLKALVLNTLSKRPYRNIISRKEERSSLLKQSKQTTQPVERYPNSVREMTYLPPLPLPPIQQGQEFLPGLRAGPHTTKHTAGGRGAACLLHPTHHHTQVARLHDHADSQRLQDLGDRQRNLLGQSLLDLQSAREHFRQTSQFRKTKDSTVRDVSDMHLHYPLAMPVRNEERGGDTFPVNGTI